jgi:spore coat-associated protein N
MKSLKKALLGTALAGTLVVGAGYGTYSWFTAQSQAAGTIDNGTLALGELQSLFKHEGFAPSQLLYSDFNIIENTGNLEQQLKATFTHSVDKANVSKYKVGYVAIKYKEKPDGDVIKNFKIRIGNLINGNPTTSRTALASNADYELEEGVLTEEEVQSLMKAQADGAKTSKTINLGNGNFWKLKDDQYIGITFGVMLSEKAGNAYQGAHYDAEFKVEATQVDEGAEYTLEAE